MRIRRWRHGNHGQPKTRRPRFTRVAARRAWLLLAVASAAAACGKKGPPRPPEPRGPLPPSAVEARQIGAVVHVAFTAPAPRGDKPSQQPVRAELVRVSYGPQVNPPADAAAFRRRGVVVGVVQGDPMPPEQRIVVTDASVTALDGEGLGWRLRYGIRVRDRRERPSPLVVAPDLVFAEAVPPPGDPEAEATADGIRLTWDPGPLGPDARFNVYRHAPDRPVGERPRNAVPLGAPEYLDGDVVTGRVYVYRVRAAGSAGPPFRESVSSAPVRIVAEDRFPPARPTGLVAVQERTGVRLFWNPNAERDLRGYRVYRRLEDGSWLPVGPDPVVEPLHLDDGAGEGVRVSYRVTAVDRADPANESPPSEEVSVILAAEPEPGSPPRQEP